MKGAIEIPYAIGSDLWWVGYGGREDWVTCPECAGTKVVRLTLGNGEQYEIDCRACSVGYDPPSGVVKHHVYEHRPTPFHARRVEIWGNSFRYGEESPESGCWRPVEVGDLYESREECAARCEALNQERAAQEATRQIQNLASKRRDLAWSVHYWRGQKRRLERELASVNGRLREIAAEEVPR
jgi:hypothetical protein